MCTISVPSLVCAARSQPLMLMGGYWSTTKSTLGAPYRSGAAAMLKTFVAKSANVDGAELISYRTAIPSTTQEADRGTFSAGETPSSNKASGFALVVLHRLPLAFAKDQGNGPSS